MKTTRLAPLCALVLAGAVHAAPGQSKANAFVQTEGFVDANGVLIYWKSIGSGAPLFILHGGPGASHDYFLPHLTPLARTNRLIFIDERGSGRSERLEDAKLYTVENMVEDVEAVRRALALGKIALLGHSFGGVLAQTYERGRYPADYMAAAWAEGYFPYLYQNRPDANYDPSPGPMMGWEVYREMWGSTGEYVVDGNLGNLDYTEKLKSVRVPTLITVGDHDESAPWISEEMQKLISGSKLVVLPKSGHMTFVDQPKIFREAVADFVHAR